MEKNIRLLIFAKHNKLIDLNKTVALLGVSTKEITNTEIRKQVNHIILIAKLAISKHKFGNCKNRDVIFASELKMRNVYTV